MTEQTAFYQKYIDDFTRKLHQRWEDFAIRHLGHNVRRVSPVKLSIPHHAYGGVDYMECLDCDKVSNGKVLHTELKDDKLIISVR